MAAEADSAGGALLDAYELALPVVYGYLLPRCGSVTLAEDLTSETFLAAAASLRAGATPHVGAAWLVGIARHKLADHWRQRAREERGLEAVAGLPTGDQEAWDRRLDSMRAAAVLAGLGAQHRLVLTLRYVDDLAVAEVADLLDRTLHATETLLVRARAAFREAYLLEEGIDA